MKSLTAPFDAYKGNKPYIFISYAHRNSEIVFRHIKRLKDEGFRIWYDEGIDPGTDWSDEIAKALANTTTFLVFVSPEMVESHNVKKEIVFALSRKKHMIAVHITETTLPDGVELQLSNIQALLENRFNDKEKFYERLFAALPPETKRYNKTETTSDITSTNQTEIKTASLSINVGDVIPFGKYEWLVLDIQDNKALIITKECIILMKIECNPHPGYASFPYSGSNIRTYVNTNLLNRFSEKEKSRIIYPTTINEYGQTLYEHIFLLSVDEAKRYLKNDSDRVAEYEGTPSLWWLRSNGRDSSKIACVYGEIQAIADQVSIGKINEDGISISHNAIGGIRPALWLELGKKYN